jgi:hypothetical protein
MPTELQAVTHDAFNDTRRFYKGGHKGTNKDYDANRTYATAAELSRVSRRTQNGAAYILMTQHNPELLLRERGMDYLSAGNMLRNSRNTFGLCSEMCCVALSYFYLRMSHAPVYVVSLHRPADHVLVLVGARPRLFRRLPDLDGMSLSQDSWIMDPWANVCCHSSLYSSEFRKKMVAWNAYGKVVRRDGEWWFPAGTFTDITLNAAVTLSDPRNRKHSL